MEVKYDYTPEKERVHTEPELFSIIKDVDKAYRPNVQFQGLLFKGGEVLIGSWSYGSSQFHWSRTAFTYEDLKSAMEEYERLQKEHK